MISSAELAEMFSLEYHPGVRCQAGVVIEEPGEDVISRWEDDGGSVREYSSAPESAVEEATLSHYSVLDPLTALIRFSFISTLAACGCCTATLVVCNKLMEPGLRSRTGKCDDRGKKELINVRGATTLEQSKNRKSSSSDSARTLPVSGRVALHLETFDR